MPSVFISYSHDSGDPSFGEKVAGLAASLLEDGIEVFFDQNRGTEEEKVTWPIWMEDKIEIADFVLLLCTELYLKKVRQQVMEDTGHGVLWEANIIYNRLYLAKLNTTKFVPVMFARGDRTYIPVPLQGISSFVLDSDEGYARLLAFLTGQHRTHFPAIGPDTPILPQKVVKRSFAKPNPSQELVTSSGPPPAEKPVPVQNLKLKPDVPPPPRQDIRGLDWYEECDAEHFLGRDKDADSILALLISNPILRLVGPSGVGKSSLVRAGLLGKMREFGWRACVVRPFDDPAQRLPEQISELLLEDGGRIIAPLNAETFRSEITPLLPAGGATRLVLLLDQFEDIVSPMASSDAVDCMREFLRGLWQNKDAKPYLRVVVVYRTDADARLGRLWQEISGRPEGLPYFAVTGLTAAMAEDVIKCTAQSQGWNVEASIPDLVRQLVIESQKLDCSGDVFPVYLQILLKQAQEAGGCLTAAMATDGGGMSGLIGAYLQRSLAQLKARGGDWTRCGHVLEALSRSTDTKAALSLQDIARETGINRTILAEMLGVLINERLVRPIGHDAYEIQHDRLAAAVIENMKEDDREAKTVREFLAAKVLMFEKTQTPLSADELTYLYWYRNVIHPTEIETRVLLASHVQSQRSGSAPVPGGWWWRHSSPEQHLPRMIQVEGWSKGSVEKQAGWAARLPIKLLMSHIEHSPTPPLVGIQIAYIRLAKKSHMSGHLALLRKLAKDTAWQVRLEAVKALGGYAKNEDLSLLRELSKDEDSDVRQEAVKVLGGYAPSEALPLLRLLAKDGIPDVSREAVKALGGYVPSEDLSLLRELTQKGHSSVRQEAVRVLGGFIKSEDRSLFRVLARDGDTDVSREAVKALGGYVPSEDLPLLRELTQKGHSSMRQEAVKALGAFVKSKDLPLFRELAEDDAWEVRLEAVTALGRYAPSEVIGLLRELAKEGHFKQVRLEAVRVLGRFALNDALPLLRELAEDDDPKVRQEAVKALGRYAKSEILPLLRELANDDDSDVCLEAVKALGRYAPSENLPLLCDLAKVGSSKVRQEAVKALGGYAPSEALPLLRELANDDAWLVRQEVVKALGGYTLSEDLPLLHKLAKEDDPDVSREAVKALGGYAPSEALPLLRELACATVNSVSAKATSILCKWISHDEAETFLKENHRILSQGALGILDDRLYMPEWMKADYERQEDE